jgi:uracil-DNA glycosylase
MASLAVLLAEVRGCTICSPHLPHGDRPVLQLHPNARVLVAGQAPGRKVHESGVPFDDASGQRLRDFCPWDFAFPRRRLKITLVIGRYAQAYHLSEKPASLTDTVKSWRSNGPTLVPMPHPSPRNNLWLRRNCARLRRRCDSRCAQRRTSHRHTL